MTERPILFSDSMIRAILSGTKTQTRRVVGARGAFWDRSYTGTVERDGVLRFRVGTEGTIVHGSPEVRCPYGAVGDQLWVREAWAPFVGPDGRDHVAFRSTCAPDGSFLWGGDGEIAQMQIHRWRPSIHMPRWASRLTLEVTSVRVARVQSISEDDARAEGCSGHDPEPVAEGGTIYAMKGRSSAPSPLAHFRALWDSINGKRPGCAWADNPWVWVVSFKVVR